MAEDNQMRTVQHFIAGGLTDGSSRYGDIFDPNIGEV